MRIAFVPGTFNKIDMDATHITLRELGKHLIEKGEQVYAITTYEKEYKKFNKRFEKIDGISVYRTREIPKNPSKFNPFSYISWLYSNIRQYRLSLKDVHDKKMDFDIINGISASPLLSLRISNAKKYFKNTKLVQNIKARSRFFLGDFFSFLLNRMDCVIVPTNFLKNRLLKFGCDEKIIKVIRSPVNTERFKPRDRELLKKKYHFSGKKIVMYYGHLSKVKGTNFLIDAINIIKDSDAQFIFVTPSRKIFRKPYEKEIERRKLSEKIKIIHEKVSIEEYVNLADVVVLPYPNLISTEGNPSCLLECMASKTPVITTDLPELREIVKKDEDVIMVEPKNSKAIAEAILDVLGNKKKTEKMVANAYKKSKMFDIKIITKQYEKLYRELLK